jgi:hypothetical protein
VGFINTRDSFSHKLTQKSFPLPSVVTAAAKVVVGAVSTESITAVLIAFPVLLTTAIAAAAASIFSYMREEQIPSQQAMLRASCWHLGKTP